MNINSNKRKSGAQWSVIERLSFDRFGERSGGRPSVLANQKVQKRSRLKKTELHVEGVRVDSYPTARELNKRRPGNAHPLGVRLLEEGVVLAANLSLIIKNSITHIAGWMREGREVDQDIDANDMHYAWEGEEEREEGIWDGDVEEDDIPVEPLLVSHVESSAPRDGANFDTEPEIKLSMRSDSPLRDEVELNKVNRLDAEEDGLPVEELDDQAGALRAMFSDSTRHT